MTATETNDALRDVLENYVAVRQLDDGRWIGVQRLMYHYTIHIGIDPVGYSDRYCLATLEMAMDAFESYDGTEEPKWWHKHPLTGRYRDLASGVVWTAADPVPEVVDGSGWPYNFNPDLHVSAAPAP